MTNIRLISNIRHKMQIYENTTKNMQCKEHVYCNVTYCVTKEILLLSLNRQLCVKKTKPVAVMGLYLKNYHSTVKKRAKTMGKIRYTTTHPKSLNCITL